MHLGERARGVGEIHQPERAHDHVEERVGERQRLGVHALEADVRRIALACPPAGHLDHGAGDVGADDTALRTHGSQALERHEPGAAGDVEHALAGPRRGARQQRPPGRGQLRLPQGLVVRRGLVPAVALHPPLQSRIHRQCVATAPGLTEVRSEGTSIGTRAR
jgi:hypothetical protein